MLAELRVGAAKQAGNVVNLHRAFDRRGHVKAEFRVGIVFQEWSELGFVDQVDAGLAGRASGSRTWGPVGMSAFVSQ